MKQFYSCIKPAQLFVFVFFFLYQSSQNLYAQCSSCSDGPPDGVIVTCDNFESYPVNQPLPKDQVTWKGWGGNSTFPNVVSLNGNNKAINMDFTSNNPDILYRLGNKKSGRYRLSWDMLMKTNKESQFVILHNDEKTDFKDDKEEDEAYSVHFRKNGKGYLNIAGKTRQDSFSYKLDGWNRVMQIIDIDSNRVELWINSQFIRAWEFDLGSLNLGSNNLGSLSFWRTPENKSNFAYYVDNICYWAKKNNCQKFPTDPVCVQSGIEFESPGLANCYLYTPKEYSKGSCERICNYARKFIEFDAPAISGPLRKIAIPSSIANISCVREYFGKRDVNKLYSDVFVFKTDYDAYMGVTWKTPPGVKSKAFVFSCGCKNGICTQDCVEEREMKVASTGEHLVRYETGGAGYFYVAIISDSLVDYSNFYITFCPPSIPKANQSDEKSTLLGEGCGLCRTINPKILVCGATFLGDFKDKESQFSGSSDPYENCSEAITREYDGPDEVHKFIIEVPSFVSVILNGNNSPMGMFLYDYNCGGNCINVAETGPNGGTATFAPMFLNPGEYYIIVDKDLATGDRINTKYTLTIDCQVSSNQDFLSDQIVCPKEESNAHQVRIRTIGALLQNSLDLTLKDRISFVYDKGQNNYVLEKGQFWNGQELVFNFFGDKSGDLEKCGYAVGDSFSIRIVNDGNVKYVKPIFGSNSNNTFSKGSNSTITGFSQVKYNSFFISPSSRKLSSRANESYAFRVLAAAESRWKITKIPSWLIFSDSTGTGPKDLIFTTRTANTNSRNRIAALQIVNADNAVQTFYAIQQGCTAAAVDLGEDRQVCEGESLILEPLFRGKFKWEDGSTSSTFKVNTSQPGTRFYSIVATSGTCTAIDSVKVTVNAKPVFDLGQEKNICLGDSVQLNASGGGTYQWSQSNATTASIFVKPAITSTYSVTVSKDGCQFSDQISVKVNPKPLANAGQEQTICSGTKTVLSASGLGTYTWSSGSTAAQIEVSPTTTTTYTLTVTTQSGCTASDQVVVVVNRATASAGSDRNICRGSSTILQASGGGTYLWSSGETTSSITVSPDTNKVYQVTVNNNNCTATAAVKVTVTPFPQASAGLLQTICLGQSAILNASGGGTYFWNTTESTQQITVRPTQSTDYTVTVTKDGCANSAQVRVTVNSAKANAGSDQSICSGQSTLLTASGGSTYKWETGETTALISVRPNETRTFTVTVTTNGCVDADSIIVFIRPKPLVTLAESRLIFGPTGFLKMNVSGGTPPYQYQWFRNDTLIFSQKDLVGLRTGIYKLVVTDANNCSVVFGPQMFVTTSTLDPSLIRNIQIFPNPSDALIYIQFNLEQATLLDISILDGLGKNIWDQKQRNFFRERLAVDLSNHPAGMYWVQFKTENGAFYKKIIRL